MAIFWGQECPLCGIKMTIGDRRFATSHFLGEESDLWRFSDAVIHWDCYAKWEHQPRFARMYFDSNRRVGRGNPHWPIIMEDDELLVKTNPDEPIAEVDIMLAATGSGFRVKLAKWQDWLSEVWIDGCKHEIERQALSAKISSLRSHLPTPDIITALALKARASIHL